MPHVIFPSEEIVPFDVIEPPTKLVAVSVPSAADILVPLLKYTVPPSVLINKAAVLVPFVFACISSASISICPYVSVPPIITAGLLFAVPDKSVVFVNMAVPATERVEDNVAAPDADNVPVAREDTSTS